MYHSVILIQHMHCCYVWLKEQVSQRVLSNIHASGALESFHGLTKFG